MKLYINLLMLQISSSKLCGVSLTITKRGIYALENT